MNYGKLAELLFPDVSHTPEYYEEKYPERDLPAGAAVTRLGPSPTGFMHLGNLYGAFVDERLARRTGGSFYLRIEDTDDKRYVEGAVDTIIESLDFFGIEFDEGAGQDGEKGDYGPYRQSDRVDIYACFAKKLLSEGKAYPCFLTEEEVEEIRQDQKKAKKSPGIYGEFSKYRDASQEVVEENLKKGLPYVIRLRSDGVEGGKEVHVKDLIRGDLTMPENFQDIVLLKANGIPTYHFAHVVDDHLMRTTHVVRGEEWLSTLPIHVELFEKLGWDMPKYCHTAQLMKIGENGNKRKLSKRLDPELSLSYYREEGYHPEAVREYLMTILNSDFEEWRKKNPDKPLDDFDFKLEKMTSSGTLFDINKLKDISKDVLIKIPADELYEFLKKWAEDCHPDLVGLFSDRDYMEKILDLGRSGKKPRKDLIYGRQIIDHISYFFDDLYEVEDEYPAEVVEEDRKEILKRYLNTYDHSDDQGEWFGKIRKIAEDLGYAPRPKDYKKNPDLYKGHVGHVSTVIRIALMGRAVSPDIRAIQQIMGEDMTRRRIEDSIESL